MPNLFLHKVENVFKAIDQFGIRTELKIDKKRKFNTAFGGFLTIIFISLFIVLFISSGSEMMNHENPNSTFTKIYTSNPEPMNFSKNGYFFVFGLQDTQGIHYYDDSIYKVVFRDYAYNSSLPFTPIVTDIPLERCTLEHLPSDIDLQAYFLKLADNLSDLLCIKKSLDGKIGIRGTWDSLNYEYSRIRIYKCSNSTDSAQPVCKSSDQISSALNDGYFALYGIDTIINTQNYKEPAKRNGYDYYTPINLRIKKSMVRFLSTTFMVSDNGWITQNLETSEYVNFDTDKESFDIIDPNANTFFMSVVLRKSIYNSIYKRDYKKVQTVLAEMGGFLKISFMVFNFVAYLFANHYYFDKISNILYSFQKTDDENEPIISKEIEITERAKFESLNLLFHQISEDHIDQIDDDQLRKYFEKLKEKPLGMSIFDYIRSFYSKDSSLLTKKNQRKKAIESISQKLDIKYILKKFLEIDKLKFLLLNNDQLQIFDNLPKPLISRRAKVNINPMDLTRIKSFHRISNLTIDSDKIKSKITLFKKCFGNIMKKNDLDEIDKRLINFVGDDLKNILGMSDSVRFKKNHNSEKNISLKETEIKIESNEVLSKIY